MAGALPNHYTGGSARGLPGELIEIGVEGNL